MIHVLKNLIKTYHFAHHNQIMSNKTKMPSKLFTKQLGTKNEKSKIGQNNLRPDIHLFKNLDWEKLHKILLIKPQISILV